MNTLRIAAAIAVILLVPTIAQARYHGSCDGFHRCRCGVTAARLHGLPLDYHGLNLKEARSYYAFPRTSCQAGAVGIPHAHHVYTVNYCNGDGTASVTDDAGTYTRRVAGNVFVSVNGYGGESGHSARSHRRSGHRHYRQQVAGVLFEPVDRLGIH